jgi:hypothetical protein
LQDEGQGECEGKAVSLSELSGLPKSWFGNSGVWRDEVCDETAWMGLRENRWGKGNNRRKGVYDRDGNQRY